MCPRTRLPASLFWKLRRFKGNFRICQISDKSVYNQIFQQGRLKWKFHGLPCMECQIQQKLQQHECFENWFPIFEIDIWFENQFCNRFEIQFLIWILILENFVLEDHVDIGSWSVAGGGVKLVQSHSLWLGAKIDYPIQDSLVPRSHLLARKGGLVNMDTFLGPGKGIWAAQSDHSSFKSHVSLEFGSSNHSAGLCLLSHIPSIWSQSMSCDHSHASQAMGLFHGACVLGWGSEMGWTRPCVCSDNRQESVDDYCLAYCTN